MVLTSASPLAPAAPREKVDSRLWNGPMPLRPPAIAGVGDKHQQIVGGEAGDAEGRRREQHGEGGIDPLVRVSLSAPMRSSPPC
jgi:hypothetical protein